MPEDSIKAITKARLGGDAITEFNETVAEIILAYEEDSHPLVGFILIGLVKHDDGRFRQIVGAGLDESALSAVMFYGRALEIIGNIYKDHKLAREEHHELSKHSTPPESRN